MITSIAIEHSTQAEHDLLRKTLDLLGVNYTAEIFFKWPRRKRFKVEFEPETIAPRGVIFKTNNGSIAVEVSVNNIPVTKF